jgi:hypothetical protein
MEGIIALHLGGPGIGQIFRKIIYLLFDSPQFPQGKTL